MRELNINTVNEYHLPSKQIDTLLRDGVSTLESLKRDFERYLARTDNYKSKYGHSIWDISIQIYYINKKHCE